MDGGSNVIPFEPLDHDVVSTKLRSWNRSHPGNLFYAELLKEYAEKANQDAEETKPEDERTGLVNQYAERIIEIITNDRKGRFLKIPDGESHPKYCLIMDHRKALHKVVHGLKNKQISLKKEQQTPGTRPEALLSPPKSAPKLPKVTQPQKDKKVAQPKKDKKVVQPKKEETKKRKSDPIKPASKKRKLNKSPKTPKVIYEAKQGEKMQINPYALELITHVCNSQSSHTNTSFLEKPISKYAIPEEEPDKERRIRLQLRHRFCSAKAVEMPVIEFSRRILEVWGGSLSETVKQPEAESPQKMEKNLSSADTKSEINPGSQATTNSAPPQPRQQAENQQNDSFFRVPNPLETSNGQNEAIEPEKTGSISAQEQKPPERATLESATQQYAAKTNGNASGVASDTPAVASSGSSLVQNVMKSVAAVSKAMLSYKSKGSSELSDANAVAKTTSAGEGDHDSSLEIKAGARQAVESADEESNSREKSNVEDHEENNEELEDKNSLDADEEEANDESTEVEDEDERDGSHDEGLENGDKDGDVTDDQEAEDDEEATATADDNDEDDNDGKGNDETSVKSSDTVETDI